MKPSPSSAPNPSSPSPTTSSPSSSSLSSTSTPPSTPKPPLPPSLAFLPPFKTPFNGYSVKFSPFYENRLAVATAQNFASSEMTASTSLTYPLTFPSPSLNSSPTTLPMESTMPLGLNPMTPSLSPPSPTALSNSTTSLSPQPQTLSIPPRTHSRGSLRRLQPCSPRLLPLFSWDDIDKLWTLDRPTNVRTFKEHAYCVYSSVWVHCEEVEVFAAHAEFVSVLLLRYDDVCMGFYGGRCACE